MYTSHGNRAFSAVVSLLIVAGGIGALVFGLAAQGVPAPHRNVLASKVAFSSVPHEKPPPPRVREKNSASKGTPSPSNIRNRATSIVALPQLAPPLIDPPPVIAAPYADSGSAAQSGAADHLGSGRGAGGDGSGRGGGGNGSGSGDDNAHAVNYPRQIRGRLHFSDLPPDLREEKAGADLKMRYRVGTDGHVSDCHILISSGRPALDAKTCMLVTQRFRFRPALDASGNPVPWIMTETHGWDRSPVEPD